MTPQTNKQALFIDWLTIYGIAMQPLELDTMHEYRRKGDVKKSMYFNSIESVEVYIDNRWQALGVICQQPTTPLMDKATVSFKVDNHILYRDDYYTIILQFLKAACIGYTHIARLDVAADFLQCYSGYTGEALAKMLAEYRLIRRGSRKVNIHARAPYKVNVDGTIQRKPGGIESVTFGSHNGVCQMQLYNKTEELRQHSMGGYCPKEYIRDAWKKAGVYAVDRDTWRLELRLNSKAKSLVNKVTGELTPITLASLAPEELANTICAIFSRWAEIRRADGAADIEHFSRLKRIHIIPPTPDLTAIVRVKPEREGLPAASYIKGVMTTIERFRTDFKQYLNDPIDAYILGDSLKAIECIYHESRRIDRLAEQRNEYINYLNACVTSYQEDAAQYWKSEYYQYINTLYRYVHHQHQPR